MLKFEDQFCSLELAKRLKELGVKQESLFVWEWFDDNCYGIKYVPYTVVKTTLNKIELYSAFSVAELGNMLPNKITNDTNEILDLYHYHGYNRYCTAYSIDNEYVEIEEFGDNEANARTKMLIYLLENKLMELPK